MYHWNRIFLFFIFFFIFSLFLGSYISGNRTFLVFIFSWSCPFFWNHVFLEQNIFVLHYYLDLMTISRIIYPCNRTFFFFVFSESSLFLGSHILWKEHFGSLIFSLASEILLCYVRRVALSLCWFASLALHHFGVRFRNTKATLFLIICFAVCNEVGLLGLFPILPSFLC